MKHSYTIDNGRYITSNGGGRGSSISEQVPLYAEDISGRFARNNILLVMKKKGKEHNKKSGRRLLSIIAASLVAGFVILFATNDTGGNAEVISQMVFAGFMLGMFIAIAALLAVGFVHKEELSSVYINELIASEDVKAALRSYYEEFALLAISDHIRTKGIEAVDISDFTIERFGTTKKEGHSHLVRVLGLHGICSHNNIDYKVKVTINFNPEYYNLKVTGFSIE